MRQDQLTGVAPLLARFGWTGDKVFCDVSREIIKASRQQVYYVINKAIVPKDKQVSGRKFKFLFF